MNKVAIFQELLNTVRDVTSIQNGDEASPSIRPADCGQLVKTLIPPESHGIF